MIEISDTVKFKHWIDGDKISYDPEMAGAIGYVTDKTINYSTGEYVYDVDFGSLNVDGVDTLCYEGEIEEIKE